MAAKSRPVTGKYGRTYRRIAEGLFGKANPALAGIPEARLARAESRLGWRLPAALCEYYRELGAFDKLNFADYRILRPEDWEIHEDKLVLCEENQNVCVWGIDPEGKADDPALFQGTQNDTWSWVRADLDLFAFLQLMIYLQAAWGGMDHLFEHPNKRKAIRAIRGSWKKVVDNQGLYIWKHGGLLLSHLRGDSFCLVAGQDEQALERLMARFARGGEPCRWM